MEAFLKIGIATHSADVSVKGSVAPPTEPVRRCPCRSVSELIQGCPGAPGGGAMNACVILAQAPFLKSETHRAPRISEVDL